MHAHTGEYDAISDHLASMFPTGGPFLPWDKQQMYQFGELVVYFRSYAVTRQNEKLAERHYVIVGPGLCDNVLQLVAVDRLERVRNIDRLQLINKMECCALHMH
mgnify:CR=1 FL=1